MATDRKAALKATSMMALALCPFFIPLFIALAPDEIILPVMAITFGVIVIGGWRILYRTYKSENDLVQGPGRD